MNRPDDPVGAVDPGDNPAPTARLVFLGTGAALHPTRCQTAIAVQFAADDVLLLDVGGGFDVVRRLRAAAIPLASVRRVFLSHRHSDHIGGLEPLLLHVAMRPAGSATAACIEVFGEARVLEAGRILIETMTSVAAQVIADRGGRLTWTPLTAGRAARLRCGAQLTAVGVDHWPYDGSAAGCVVEFALAGRTRRLVYSGDTRPTPALERVARCADVLLHEAGGLDRDAATTHSYGHSTAGDAARLAAAAGVGRLYLYHVTSDQAVPALLDEARRYFSGPIAIPDDLDSVELV